MYAMTAMYAVAAVHAEAAVFAVFAVCLGSFQPLPGPLTARALGAMPRGGSRSLPSPCEEVRDKGLRGH